VDALEYKLDQVLAREAGSGVEGRRRVVDSVLGVIALAPPLSGQAGAVKSQLMINRIARRLALKEETVWARLDELRQQRGNDASRMRRRFTPEEGAVPESGSETGGNGSFQAGGPRQAPAAPEERDLLQIVLADPNLVPEALASVSPQEVLHPGLQRLYKGLADLHAAGEPPTLDRLRPQLDNARLAEKALEMQEVGRANSNRPTWLRDILAQFQARRDHPAKQEIHNQLQAANDSVALELLRRLINKRTIELGPDVTPTGDWKGGAPPSTSPDTGIRS